MKAKMVALAAVLMLGGGLGAREVAYQSPSAKHGDSIGGPRNYAQEVTAAEREDIRFLMRTLANKSLISIACMQHELEMAGDRINHVHPLRFLMTIFTDEEMKAAIRNVRGRGWVWDHFIGGLRESLNAEACVGNMNDAILADFSQRVSLPLPRFAPYVQRRDWNGFVDTLIREIPRKGDHDRYND